MKAFCKECRNKVKYYKREITIIKIKGRLSFTYKDIESVCIKCGSYVFVPKLIDKNLKSYNKVYKKAMRKGVEVNKC